MTAVAGQTSIFSMIPSETFKKKYLNRLAVALIGTSTPEEELQIQQEIEQGVENIEHQELLSGKPVSSTGDTIKQEKESTDPLDVEVWNKK